MNLSLQNYPFNSSLNSEFTQCMNAGILLCICAGNQGTNNDDTPNYPSSYSQANIIAVGNLMRTDVRSTNSNFGLVSVDLFAPGTTILAPVLGTDYGNKTGTSMSTPFVTAVAAVIKQLNPDWQHAEIKNSILLSVTLRPAYSGICVTGGRLNALAAVAHAVKQEPLAHLDGDGFPNFFEYAVGSRMDDRSEQPQLLFSAHAGAFQLTLPHAGRDGVMIRLERFTNSGVWTDGGLTDLSSSGQKAGSIPLDGSAGRLLRFVIEAPP
jgi:subtilisin family serine protease